MKQFVRVTSFMHVPDVKAAIAFFRDLLGFTVYIDEGGYGYVQREGCGFRLLQNSSDPTEAAPPGNRRFAYYIDVEDVDALYAELKTKLDALPAEDVHGPADKPYGQRELVILAPDGNLLAFGCPVQPPTV